MSYQFCPQKSQRCVLKHVSRSFLSVTVNFKKHIKVVRKFVGSIVSLVTLISKFDMHANSGRGVLKNFKMVGDSTIEMSHTNTFEDVCCVCEYLCFQAGPSRVTHTIKKVRMCYAHTQTSSSVPSQSNFSQIFYLAFWSVTFLTEKTSGDVFWTLDVQRPAIYFLQEFALLIIWGRQSEIW